MVTLHTIGHSNHSIEGFVAILRAHQIETLVDVRRFPGSRKWPQFNREALTASLNVASIDYHWMEMLGGRRSSKDSESATIDPASVAGWENSSFRTYAAYMQTPMFASALDELITLAESQRTAIMCAEAVWWRCHRRLISDALVAKRHDVLHVLSHADAKPHALTEFARVLDDVVRYPAPLFDQPPP